MSRSEWIGGRRGSRPYRGSLVCMLTACFAGDRRSSIGGKRTEEHILEHDRLLSQSAEVAVHQHLRVLRDGLLLYARPGEVNIEEQQEDAEADDRRVELVAVPHQSVVQQVPVDLRLDQDEVDEQDDIVVFDILVAEPAAVPAHREADVVPTGLVTGARVLRP